MVILAESPELLGASASARDVHRVIEAARLLGVRVFDIPPDFERCGTAENALAHVPEQPERVTAFWVGFIPEPARYEAIYAAALAKNIRLINTPAEHRTALEFEEFYRRLVGLTPESFVARDIAECAPAASAIGYPVFVKGSVQSRKRQGWKACVAESEAELLELCEWLFTLKYGSRGRVVIRRLVRLRHERVISSTGMPQGREFRVFLLRNEVLRWGYYWREDDPLARLSPAETTVVLQLACEAARRLEVPYCAIDIGQLESGEWIVIETADAQFAGLCGISALELWCKVSEWEQNVVRQESTGFLKEQN